MKLTPKKHRMMQFSSEKGHYKRLMKKGKRKYKHHLWVTEKNYLQGDTRGYPWQEIIVWKHIPDEQGGDYFWHMRICFYRLRTIDGKYMVKIAMNTKRGWSSETSIGTTEHKSASTANKRISRVERSLYRWLNTHNHSKSWKPPKR